MKPLLPRFIEPSSTNGQVLTTVAGKTAWAAPGAGSGGGSAAGEFDWSYEPYPNQGSPLLRETRLAGTWGYTSANIIAGGFIYNTSNAQNDSIAFSVWLSAGSYALAIIGGTDTNRAIQTWDVDDGAGNYSPFGTIDWYGSNTNDVLKTLTNLTVTGGLARRKLRATCATRNPSSVGWYQSIQRVNVIRTA